MLTSVRRRACISISTASPNRAAHPATIEKVEHRAAQHYPQRLVCRAERARDSQAQQPNAPTMVEMQQIDPLTHPNEPPASRIHSMFDVIKGIKSKPPHDYPDGYICRWQ